MTPPLLTRRGFLWRVEFDDNSLAPGTCVFVYGWTFRSAYRRALPLAPGREPQHRQIKVWRMERVTPLTVRYWEMR